MGEIVNRITRKNSKLISELPLTISAQQGLIDQNEFFDKRVASKDVSGYYLIKNGEFAYNKSTSNDAPWGAIKRLDRYENGVLSTLYIVFEIKDETLVNSDFLVAYYSTNLWYKGIHEIAAEGARNHGLLNIAPTDFFKTKLKLPADIEEQQEIGEYFKKIDSLITFHHHKSNLFNKTCRNAWEQRKVSEIAIEKLSNGIMNNQSDDETGVKHINVINMYDTDKIHPEKLTFSNYDEEAVKKCNVEFGDIFLTRSSLKPEGIAEANVLLDSGRFVYDDHLIRLKVNKEKYDSFFVKLNLSGNAFKRQFIVRAKTTAFTTIGQEDISECLGFFPQKEEQQQISEYFMILDQLITLHQRKCNQLQIIRKYMLKNMFL